MKFKIIVLTIASCLVFACSSDDSQVQQQDDMEDPTDDSGGGQNEPDPTAFVVTSFSPTQAYTGETVTIVGDSIDLNTEYIVTFNDIVSPRVTVSETKLEAVIPNGEAGGDIRIQHDNFDIQVGTIDVIVERAFIFAGYSLMNPNSGLASQTQIRHPLSDDARVYIENRVIDPAGNNDLVYSSIDMDTEEVYGGAQGNMPERRWTGSSEGFLFTDGSNSTGAWLHKFNKEVFAILEMVQVPPEYTLLSNMYFEDISRLGYIVTIAGESGKHLWKVNMETGDSQIVSLGNNMLSFGESIDEELLAVNGGTSKQLVKVDRNTGMIAEVIYDGIPEGFTAKRIMQSKSTGRYFFISPTQIFIINPNDGSVTLTDYELNYPLYRDFDNSIFKILNF
tara:strand:- start:119542 stop:120717 length:1176 start_codon:yes stop_codon:yes gene_type:complete